MKVISTNPDGSALVEFDNLVRQTEVIGVTAPIQAVISISSIPDLIRIGQKARRAGQRIHANLAKMAKARCVMRPMISRPCVKRNPFTPPNPFPDSVVGRCIFLFFMFAPLAWMLFVLFAIVTDNCFCSVH